MQKKVKVNTLICLFGLLCSSSSFAGVNAFCQNLHDAGSIDKEPQICSNFIQSNHNSMAEFQPNIDARGGTTSSSTSYIYESRASDTMSTHPVNDFSTQTLLGVVFGSIRAMAFDETAGVLYAVDNDGQQLMTVNQTTGAVTTVGPLTNMIAADVVTGLDIAPDGTCYVTSTDNLTNSLYTCELNTGTLTLVGSQTTTPLLTAIAADCEGNIYGHDVGDDTIYALDAATGAATAIGPTGLDANFAQDITYDREEHRLYGYIYTGGNSNTYGTIDVCTGAVTPLAVDSPVGEYFGASKTDCALSDIIFRGTIDC